MDAYQIGVNIKNIREMIGMTQERLAELTDISITYLSLIESGNADNVSLIIIYNISSHLNVTVGMLVDGYSYDKLRDRQVASKLNKIDDKLQEQLIEVTRIMCKNEEK